MNGQEVAVIILLLLLYVIPAFVFGFILISSGGGAAFGGLGLVSFTVYAIIRSIKEYNE